MRNLNEINKEIEVMKAELKLEKLREKWLALKEANDKKEAELSNAKEETPKVENYNKEFNELTEMKDEELEEIQVQNVEPYNDEFPEAVREGIDNGEIIITKTALEKYKKALRDKAVHQKELRSKPEVIEKEKEEIKKKEEFLKTPEGQNMNQVIDELINMI